MEKLREQYKNEVIPAMMKKFNYSCFIPGGFRQIFWIPS